VFMDQILHEMDIDAADILVLNPRNNSLEYFLGSGFKTNALQYTHLRPGDGWAGKAILHREIIQINDLVSMPDGLLKSPFLMNEGFIGYIALPLIAKGMVKGVLEVFTRSPLKKDPEWIDFLGILAGQAAIAIDNLSLFNELQVSNFELIQAYDATIAGWSRALELRDHDTEGHSQRVMELTMRLAREAGMCEDEIVHIRRGALMHDIGKMGIPDVILHKPGSLADEEWAIMKTHPQIAYDLLSNINFLTQARDIPYCHHEKWDGSGYPQGLAGEAIPLSARLFAIVDVWDALSSDRPYRKAWPEKKIIDYINSLSGSHFDPLVVRLFNTILETFQEIQFHQSPL
jgi:HD-GYP domain-containing protein (c-di-GMP phosphodiesterase class II)